MITSTMVPRPPLSVADADPTTGGDVDSPKQLSSKMVNGVVSNGMKNIGIAGSSSSKCEELYGPYPPSMPVPFVANIRNEAREGDVPASDVLKKAAETAAAGVAAEDAGILPCDERDAKTPDNWVVRDGRLVRLTGKHPFNVEPPLAVLNQYRFITPHSLHYVRNHGACPKLKWDEHTIVIGGEPDLVPKSGLTFTMDDLTQLQAREMPVTLVCAGNRRKEQNQMRQTIGFNWGGAGVSTNVWKGVLVRDLLLAAGVDPSQDMYDKHVEFIGVEDLPNKVGPGPFVDKGEEWGKHVKYGTSIPLARVMNSAYDVMVAYEANGQKIAPDHGFPCRLIIPGYIGGRMIKWLAKINVISHVTYNHYHYHDNRILPPEVTSFDQSLKEHWWYKPEYIFNELNINSVATKPDHDEKLDLKSAVQVGTYKMSGYAYTGGGRMVTRVEVSTNSGRNWRVASLDRKERPTPHGMYWCWTWWDYDLCVADELIGCSEIWCRAWDESNNVQPHEPTWNLMGMGNNQVFKIKVHMEKDDVTGAHQFRFEHPTQPGQQKGGWMTRIADKPLSAGFGKILDQEQYRGEQATTTAAAEVPKAAKPGEKKIFTLDEIKKHNTEHDCWIIVKDRVYDATEYLELHPGGVDSITINAGDDATEDFVAIHSSKATSMLEKFYIGDVDQSSLSEEKKEDDDCLVDEKGNKLALNPRKKTPFRLQNKTVLSRDSFLLDFALPTPQHVLGLPTGKHMFLSARINGETVLRRYTPVSSNHDVGCVKFLIKAYRPCPRFPEGGKMSQYVDTLKIGDYLDMRGPVGEFEYLSNGKFLIDGKEQFATKFNMISGGTGITPVMQIAAEILRNPDDKTQMFLIFGAREEGDLLMREQLEEWARDHPHRFKLHYILSDKWPTNWQYSTGFVDRKLFDEYLYEAADDVYNLMCGPPVMIERGCIPNLEALGHAKSRNFSF